MQRQPRGIVCILLSPAMPLDPFEQANQWEQAANVLRAARHVVVFTGAGVSAESGIPTFRDADGLWQEFPPEQFVTWQGLIRTALLRPRRLAAFVQQVIEPIARAEPNAAHRAIERLERHTRVTVVTQNIDGLHEAAGSTTVHAVHGTLFEVVTAQRRFLRLLNRAHLLKMAERLARLRRAWFLPLARVLWTIRPLVGWSWRGFHRPKLVLFGDRLCEPDWSLAVAAIEDCDCVLQIGCSGQVFPAALLTLLAKEQGATVVAIDPNETASDLWLAGAAGEVMPELLHEAFGDSAD